MDAPARQPAARLRWAAAIVAVLALALALRLWGVRSGLPFIYNTDENQHFVPRAIGLFGHGLDPGYFSNPPAYTYLLALIYAIAFGGRVALSHTFATNPSEVWLIGRVSAAALGTIAVGLLYLTGARLFGRASGLLAAALAAVAFLPVFYSKLALNDVPTLAPLTLSLWGSAGILRRGARRDYAIAGIGLGLAAATKYTGGIAVVPLLAAALARRRAGGDRAVARRLALAGALAIVAFLAADPYALLDASAFWHGIVHQSATSDAGSGKLGLTHGSGVLYYLWTITWGVGWLPALAALGALGVLWRGERALVALLAPALVLYVLFMGLQGRYFGRWLMPIVPLLCLLAAHGALRAAALLGRRRPRARPLCYALAAVALCGQGLLYSVHAGIVGSRADTRALARRWLVAHVPLGSRIVVEPVVPDAWAADVGRALPTATGYRWLKFPATRTQLASDGTLRVGAGAVVSIEDYERELRPALIGLYERAGYCWVLSGSTQSGRALVDPRAVPLAIAYYRALARAGTVVFRSTPYARGAAAVAFNFDWAFDYYPLAYSRPGPVITVYRLRGGRCSAGAPYPSS